MALAFPPSLPFRVLLHTPPLCIDQHLALGWKNNLRALAPSGDFGEEEEEENSPSGEMKLCLRTEEGTTGNFPPPQWVHAQVS